MEFFDYDLDEEECDKLLEEAEPCEECGETETLALAVITDGEHFGTLIVFCMDCDPNEKSDFSVAKKEKTLYA